MSFFEKIYFQNSDSGFKEICDWKDSTKNV